MLPLAVEEQAEEIRKVKRFENGFIAEPMCLAPNDTVADLDQATWGASVGERPSSGWRRSRW